MARSSPPDMLRFLDAIEGEEIMVAWSGPWPPPKQMALAIGSETGMIRVIERPSPDAVAPIDTRLLEQLEDAPSITVVDYGLRNASKLPDDFDDAHVFRGAEYEREVK